MPHHQHFFPSPFGMETSYRFHDDLIVDLYTMNTGLMIALLICFRSFKLNLDINASRRMCCSQSGYWISPVYLRIGFGTAAVLWGFLFPLCDNAPWAVFLAWVLLSPCSFFFVPAQTTTKAVFIFMRRPARSLTLRSPTPSQLLAATRS